VKDYRFSASWTLPAPRSVVYDVLVDLEHYPDWWREVRAVAKVSDDEAIVICRSWLPYSLELDLTAVHRDPGLLEVAIDGDLAGHARWRLAVAADATGGTQMDFEQSVRVASRPLAIASYVARPLLVWNHDRMMRSCLEGLAGVVGGVRRGIP